MKAKRKNQKNKFCLYLSADEDRATLSRNTIINVKATAAINCI
jgi:hypothetical protein